MNQLSPIDDFYADAARALHARWSTLNMDDWLRPVAPFIAKQQGGRRVLDVGAGTGDLATEFAQAGCRVTAIEPVAEMWHADLPRVEDRLPRLGKLRGPFDLVLCLSVLHHLPPADQTRAFRRMAELTRPGGTMILSTRHGPGPWRRWPIRAASLAAPGLSRIHKSRSPSIGAYNRREGVRWTWLVFRKS
ncbi:MAG: class I SAM-dependent methyltransferase [Pseudomonadota bacterium]